MSESKVVICVQLSQFDGHGADRASCRVSVWVGGRIPPDVLGERVVNGTDVRANAVVVVVGDIAELVDLKRENCSFKPLVIREG